MDEATVGPDERDDYIDHVRREWARERPDMDTAGLAVLGRISRLTRYLERAMETSFEEFGLNGAGFYVLAALRRSGPPFRLTPTRLSIAMLTSSGAMTNRIDRLERAGYIVRVPDEVDGRSSLVSLTPEGLGVIESAIQVHATNEIDLLAILSDDERHDLARLLKKLLLSRDDVPRTSTISGAHPVPLGPPRGTRVQTMLSPPSITSV